MSNMCKFLVCPECKSTIDIEFDLQTGEHFVECFECGYNESNQSLEELKIEVKNGQH